MNFFAFTLLLGAFISSTALAAMIPAIKAGPSSSVSFQCAPSTILSTVTETVTYIPPTVTIAIENASAIASSLAWDASIDTQQVSEQIQHAPVSNSIDDTTHTFVHSIVVPAFEATEAPHTGSSVYYVSVGPNTTDWSYTPTGKITVGVTTVTVLPVAHTPAPDSTITVHSTLHTTVTNHTGFTMSSSGWNKSSASSATVNGVTTGPISRRTTTVNSTVRSTLTTRVTVNVTVLASASSSVYTTPTYKYGSSVFNSTSEVMSGVTTEATTTYGYGTVQPRQTCVMISAYINGAWASWCNNWAGSSTLTYSTWETTVTASNIPGLDPSQTTTASHSVTQVSGSSSATPTSCGESGPFTIDFDNLPVFSPTDNNSPNFPLIFNPFEHFWWGDGWTYGPPPSEPFPPHNGTRLAEYIPSLANTNTGSPNAGLIPNSSFGAGPRNYNDNYWFNAKSVWVGCDNGSEDPSVVCDFMATGWQWDPVERNETIAVTQHFSQPSCPGFRNCELQQINFNEQFNALTTLSFSATVLGEIKIFWIDSLELDWYNNTCAAGLARISARKI